MGTNSLVRERSLRFSVAGLEVALHWSGAGGPGYLTRVGCYDAYPSAGGAPDLSLSIDRIPGFATGRERGPDYPGFQCELVGPGRIALSRFDAEGELCLPESDGATDGRVAVRGRFRVGDSVNSVEAIMRIGMSVALPRAGGLILHCSAIAVDGGAHVFAGVSGAGKSTIAAMLETSRPKRYIKLADELLIAAPLGAGAPDADARLAAHVTPFIGSQGLPHGARVPVVALYFLQQAPYHECQPISRADGVRELLRHVLVYVAEPDTARRVLAIASRLVEQVACHRLRFARDPGVASVLAVT